METHRLLAKLREKSQFSIRDLVERTGLAVSSIQRAENPKNYLLRGETLDALLTRGYKMKPESPEYRKIVAAWTRDRLKGFQPRAAELMAEVANLPAAKLAKLKRIMKEL